jgi:hypothetical protein
MNALNIIGKLSVLATIMMVLVLFQPSTASGIEPVFEIRAKDGTAIVGETARKLAGSMDPENTVRMGLELRPRMMIGFNSKHGFGLLLEF